jgi:hypothetical protein
MFALGNAELGAALLVAVVLMLGLWGPYLYEEIVHGKDKKRRRPVGAGDTRPGHPGIPAPGQTDAQADPWTAGPPR